MEPVPTFAHVRSAAVTPALLAFVASARVRQRSHTAFRLLQRVDPVHQSPLGIVVLSGHAEVAAALRNPALGSDEAHVDPSLLRVDRLSRLLSRNEAPADQDADFVDLLGDLMIFQDPPTHTRLRALVAKAFTPRRVEGLEPRIQAIIDELLAPGLARRQLELMHDVAYPFPARVICELLGLPTDGQELFIRHAPTVAIGLDPAPMRTTEGLRRANLATRELRAYLSDLIAARRCAPAGDLLSALVTAESDGATLTDDELIAVVLLLVIAGHETTANVIGSAVHRMLGDDDLRRWVREADDAGLRTAVEEFLRLDGPVQMAQRVTTGATTVGGLDLVAGRTVVLLPAAANRDRHVFDEPRRFVPDRVKNPHLAFGAGVHFCIGAPLARLELRVALRALARGLPAAARPTAPVVWRRSFTIRGLETLPLGW